MNAFLPKNSDGCPYLFLAPMEGVGDRPFRQAMASIGGFDEACTEFLRVPAQAHVPSLAKRYIPNATYPIPEAVQLMGSDPELMAEMAREVAKMGATRIDLNCGCPSNTVTGRGAGSSLLKEPQHLYTVAKSIVDAVSIPVTAKLRSGFEDTSLFKENLLAAEASGIRFLTLHPRTKVEGYLPPARWDLIAEAKQLLRIPVVGNGDILSVKDAVNMLDQTGCDALMIGRGSVINPFIFQEIKAHYSGIPYIPSWDDFIVFINTFVKGLYPELTLKGDTFIISSQDSAERGKTGSKRSGLNEEGMARAMSDEEDRSGEAAAGRIPDEMMKVSLKGQISKMKQLFGFLFKKSSKLLEHRNTILRSDCPSVESFLEFALPLYRQGFEIAWSK